jgi:methionyl-tRNA formyltransferase
MAGDAQSGVMVMRMEEGLDTGPVGMAERVTISPEMNAGELHDRLCSIGADLMVRALAALSRDSLQFKPQSEEGVTYAHKIEKAEALIDWSKSAAELDRHIRAFNPFPGAQALFGGQTVKIWQARPVDAEGEKGTILAIDRSILLVACGAGALAVSELQKAGGKRLPVQQFLAGHPLKVGDRFDFPA